MNATQILPAVAAVIFNDNGEVLLQKRKDVDKWCIISGHVEFGETIENAILREIQEETDSTAKIIRLIGVYSSPDFQTYFYKDKIIQYITSYFEVKMTGTIPSDFSNSETKELKFFSVDHLPTDFALISPFWLNDALDKKEAAVIR
jgi:ADP-ribose pyrophosphatase YjhB (NUDIX family)